MLGRPVVIDPLSVDSPDSVMIPDPVGPVHIAPQPFKPLSGFVGQYPDRMDMDVLDLSHRMPVSGSVAVDRCDGQWEIVFETASMIVPADYLPANTIVDV